MEIPEIGNVLQNAVNGKNSPSVQYALFDKDNIKLTYSIGHSNIGENKVVNGKTTYNAFSVTKTFTALAILILDEQKKIDINQYVKFYVPEIPYPPNISIKQLLSHSGGIPNPNPLSWIHLLTEHKLFDRNDFFKEIFLENKKIRSLPDVKFSYSNLGYLILGQLIEKVTGTSYEQYITENILQKLGLKNNDLGFEIHDINNHAKGYQKKLSLMNLVLGFFIDKSKYMEKAEGSWKPFRNYYVNGAPYGGLIGTMDAFVRYIQELLKTDSTILSDHQRKLMFTENFTSDNKASGMCLSWYTGELNGNRYFAHAGGGGGYYCEIRLYPGRGIGSVIFFNRTGVSDERFLNKVDRYYFERTGAGEE